MAEVYGFKFPEDLLYDAEKHVWAKLENGNVITLGITDLGQYMIGRIFAVEPKEIGAKINSRTPVFTLESAKWVGKFRFPVEGEVIDVNKELIDHPEKINEDPYNAWIVKIKVEKIPQNFKPFSEVKSYFEKEGERIAKR
ncbi:glycine cleavage system protein H [Acidianus sulfidivorans JP7]|uniref:Probable glycine cleavage system H protein n=1 Tax=Acidianus sulfidivorans JP7 TaxID=619593 RepID=A0A2U9IPS2_9CREN|nr:glycine cleavage system protein H [Acidianus sulfidivorans]AWR97976.1 glycine cleavage system protein H [Acidianus sulfidivorans JP7]